MTNSDHNKALKDHNLRLLKKSTELSALVQHLREDHESFKKSVHKKLEETIRIYDKSNESVIRYLLDHDLVDNHHLAKIHQLFPIKLG